MPKVAAVLVVPSGLAAVEQPVVLTATILYPFVLLPVGPAMVLNTPPGLVLGVTVGVPGVERVHDGPAFQIVAYSPLRKLEAELSETVAEPFVVVTKEDEPTR